MIEGLENLTTTTDKHFEISKKKLSEVYTNSSFMSNESNAIQLREM